MNKPKPLPSLQELQEIFDLTEKFPSGLVWKINPSKQGGKKAGSMAGYMPNQGARYWRVKYKQKLYPCHRIRWSLLNNRLISPEEYVDHVNRNAEDNRGELRIVTRSQNQYNRSRVKNKSGFRWVIYTEKCKSKPWRILMKINGRCEYFGYYKDAYEAALEADKIAVKKLNIDYLVLNFPELQLKQ
jgi:hypothetical protein